MGAVSAALPTGLVSVTAVSVKEFGDKVQVAVVATGPVRHRVAEWAGKPDTWIVVDLVGAQLGIPAGQLPQRTRDVERIRVGQFNPKTVRVVLELTRPRVFAIRALPEANGLQITILRQAGPGGHPWREGPAGLPCQKGVLMHTARVPATWRWSQRLSTP